MNHDRSAERDRHDYDVVVVGGRVAGASTALVLARLGHRVLVVEKGQRGADTLSTHALMRGGVVQLHRWGLLDRILAAGTPAIRRTTFHYGDEVVAVPLKAGGGIDALYAPRRTVLDPVLSDAASEAGAEVRFGTAVTGLRTDGQGTVTGVDLAGSDGGRERLSARLVVGADGSHSRVARAVGAHSYFAARHTGAVAYAYFDDPDADGYEWFYVPGAGGGVIPTNDGSLVWVSVPPDRFRTELRHDVAAGFWSILSAVAAPVAARLRDADRSSRWRTSPGLLGYHRQSFGAGWALVGDAAHFKDPITAHGLTDAMRDAELLARSIDSGLRGTAPMLGALGEYQRVRDEVSRPFSTLTDRVASYRWDLAELRELLLAAASLMQSELALIEGFDLEPAA